MKHPYFADLLKRYLHDDTTEGEAWTVEQWYEARDMPRPAPPTPAEQAATRARMWQQVQARTRSRPWQAPVVRWAAAAALLVLALGAGWWQARWQPTAAATAAAHPPAFTTRAQGRWLVSTNASSRAVPLALPDGSTVALSPNSSLRYPPHFRGAERVVTLRGEAFFEVFHDAAHPFRVLTDKVETTVLGTSFTVRAFPGGAEAAVMVRTGRVRVQPRATAAAPASRRASLLLTPNQQAVYSPGAAELRRALVEQPRLLRPQALVFKERPVAEVLRSLQAGYGVPIRYNEAALASCTVSLAFTTETLFEKLDLLCKTLDGSYEQTEGVIIFRSRGCLSE